MIISKGRLVASDTPENLEKMLGEHNSVEIETGASPSEVRLILKNVPGIEMIETQEKGDSVTWAKITEKKGEDIRERVFMAFASAKTPLLTLKAAGMTLEDVFMELTQSDAVPDAFIARTKWEEVGTDAGDL